MSPAKTKPKCCTEYNCQRKRPMLIRKGGFGGVWYVITDHREEKEKNTIVARVKHDVTVQVQEQVIAPVLAALLDEDLPREVIDRVAERFGLVPSKKDEAGGKSE